MEGTKILNKTMEEVMHESMIPYSEYVILDRALPRVEDGLKPVQRRVLYSMNELGLTPDKPFKKCARIVGDCLGKYHPHGDSSVYLAMVRMAQPFNMGSVLVDGHGNFGSIDGDGAAAMRYTEARLAPIAMELIRDLEKNTVKWSPNFDDTTLEPDFLPGRFPNLLVNGASGIAVGLATNIPPHNFSEAVDGVIAYIDNPRIKLAEMMKIIKAPDFPGGGIIIKGELEKAYETGKGKIAIRAKVHIENEGEKKLIVIDELPFQVNKALLLETILKVREEKKGALSYISDITDESDRSGMRAVIKVKKDGDPNEILEILFKSTNLHVTFGINMVAIADGKPQQMGLLDIIAYYVDYQRSVIIKRTRFDLEQAKERAHILEGLVIAVQNIDEVIRIIKTSKNTTEAKDGLKKRFELSEKQAQAIIDLRLGRLTKLEVYKLENELEELRALIQKLTAILGSKKMQMDTVKSELSELKRKYKISRKSTIISDISKYEYEKAEDLKLADEYIVVVTQKGEIKKMLGKSFNMANKFFGENSSLNEMCVTINTVKSDEKLMLFTNKGNCYKVALGDIVDGKWKEKGTKLNELIKDFDKDEKVIYARTLDESENGEALFYTKKGMIKRTAWSEYLLVKNAFQTAKLKDDDEIIGIETLREGCSLMFVTKYGMTLNAEMTDIPMQGRISTGVKGIKLSEGDECIMVSQVDKNGYVALLTDRGFAKRVAVESIEIIKRYGKGVKIFDLRASNGEKLVYAKYVTECAQPVIELDGDYMMCVPTDNFSIETRVHQGKALIKGKAKVTRVIEYLDKVQQ